jgi:hypothetical protein
VTFLRALEIQGILENYEGHDMFIVSGSGSGTGISVTDGYGSGTMLNIGNGQGSGKMNLCRTCAIVSQRKHACHATGPDFVEPRF